MARRYSWTKRLSWQLEYAGYRFFEFLLQRLPFAAVDYLGSFVGWLLFHASSHYRELAMRNLRIAYGDEKSLTEIKTLARKTCQRTIANFIGSLKTTVITTDEVEKHVSFQGKEFLDSALSQGKGAILVLGHMGNWEILNRLHQFLPPGTLAGGIYQPLKNPHVNALLLRRREQDGSQMFNKRDGFHAPASFVKEGGLLIVVADQKAGRSGTAVPFFGRMTSLSPLPSILARKVKSPTLAASIETLSPGKWQVVFTPLGDTPHTTAIVAALETGIRNSPADYLWLHNRWKLNPTDPLAIKCRKEENTRSATRLTRILILTENLSATAGYEILLSGRQKNSRNFPLTCDILTLGEDDAPLPETASLHHLSDPTMEQLAATLVRLNLATPHPIEAIIIPVPSPLLEKAARRARIPTILVNRKALATPDFFATLIAASVE